MVFSKEGLIPKTVTAKDGALFFLSGRKKKRRDSSDVILFYFIFLVSLTIIQNQGLEAVFAEQKAGMKRPSTNLSTGGGVKGNRVVKMSVHCKGEGMSDESVPHLSLPR